MLVRYDVRTQARTTTLKCLLRVTMSMLYKCSNTMTPNYLYHYAPIAATCRRVITMSSSAGSSCHWNGTATALSGGVVCSQARNSFGQQTTSAHVSRWITRYWPSGRRAETHCGCFRKGVRAEGLHSSLWHRIAATARGQVAWVAWAPGASCFPTVVNWRTPLEGVSSTRGHLFRKPLHFRQLALALTILPQDLPRPHHESASLDHDAGSSGTSVRDQAGGLVVAPLDYKERHPLVLIRRVFRLVAGGFASANTQASCRTHSLPEGAHSTSSQPQRPWQSSWRAQRPSSCSLR